MKTCAAPGCVLNRIKPERQLRRASHALLCAGHVEKISNFRAHRRLPQWWTDLTGETNEQLIERDKTVAPSKAAAPEKPVGLGDPIESAICEVISRLRAKLEKISATSRAQAAAKVWALVAAIEERGEVEL